MGEQTNQNAAPDPISPANRGVAPGPVAPASQGATTTPEASAAESAQPAEQPDTDAASNLALLRAFRRCAHLQRLVSGHRGQDRVLIVLLTRGAMSQSRLAKEMQRQPATLSQQLEAMEQAGLVSRAPNGQDRRLLDVSLTPAGRAEAHAALERNQATADALFGGLASEQDRVTLARILRELAATWDAIAGGAGVPSPTGAPSTPAGSSHPTPAPASAFDPASPAPAGAPFSPAPAPSPR